MSNVSDALMKQLYGIQAAGVERGEHLAILNQLAEWAKRYGIALAEPSNSQGLRQLGDIARRAEAAVARAKETR